MTEINSPSDVPLRIGQKVPVEWLKLDRRNPRLVSSNTQSNDEDTISQLYKTQDLSELIESIGSNGYLDIEPLIVQLDTKDNRLIVLEGNRRVASIRLFREPELVEKVCAQGRVRITLPQLPENLRKTLDEVTVYRVANREDARAFIGFKHINGAAKWDSFAKARFAASWYKSEKASLDQIARKIGDRHDTVKRMVNGIYVLEQAENKGIYKLSDRTSPKFNFSHLYTALSRIQYMNFLGLGDTWRNYDLQENPIPDDNLECLREVLVWIYGSKEDSRQHLIISQNPDIKNLGLVLDSAEGLNVLRSGSSLEEALSSTIAASEKFSSSLIKARSLLRETSNNLRGYDGKDRSLLNISEDISETAQIIHKRMQKKSCRSDNSAE